MDAHALRVRVQSPPVAAESLCCPLRCLYMSEHRPRLRRPRKPKSSGQCATQQKKDINWKAFPCTTHLTLYPNIRSQPGWQAHPASKKGAVQSFGCGLAVPPAPSLPAAAAAPALPVLALFAGNRLQRPHLKKTCTAESTSTSKDHRTALCPYQNIER